MEVLNNPAYLERLAQGLGWTLVIFIGSALLMLVCSVLAGVCRVSRNRFLRWGSLIYIDAFRGTAALVQIFWVFYALPFFGISVEPIVAGILVLGMNAGAYGAEVVRGSLRAISAGQWEVATSLNLGRGQTMWRIALPQAAITMLPPCGNLLIELLKNTALVYFIGVHDFAWIGTNINESTYASGEIFGAQLVVYFILAMALAQGIYALELKLGRSRGLARS